MSSSSPAHLAPETGPYQPRHLASLCPPQLLGNVCRDYGAGHAMHWIHAKQLGRQPWGWRPALVVRVDRRRGWLQLAYLAEAAEPRLWHHRPLHRSARVGDTVRLHEGLRALEVRGAWLHVSIEHGAGPVPEPADPQVWEHAVTVGAVALRTGRGLALA